MKTKYIITSLVALAAILTGCKKEGPTYLNDIKVSSSYVTFKPEGSTTEITVTANADWKVDTTGWKKAKVTEWLSISSLKGVAGESKLSFTATAATSTREASCSIVCGKDVQNIKILQQTKKEPLPETKVGTLIADKTIDGNYRVRGIASGVVRGKDGGNASLYGNWYLTDDTGKVYVYGTLDKTGSTKGYPMDAWDIENGDEVTIEGHFYHYQGKTPEFENAEVIKVVKSLLKVEPETAEVAKEGGDVKIVAKYKGNDLKVLPQDSWISLGSMEACKDSTIVILKVAANEGDVRQGTVKISSSIPTQTSEATVTITQASGLSCYPLPYTESFSENQGAWTIADVTKPESVENVWAWGGANYGMKATAYINYVRYETESDLISPLLDLTEVSSATLSFDQVQRFAENPDAELTLWISTDNGETWNQLLIPEYTSGGNWNFITSKISLTPYVGHQAAIKFTYKSSSTVAATWEIKNVSITEGEIEPTCIAQINGMTCSAEKAFTATLTDAVVTYVNGRNVFIQDKTGGIQLYKNGHTLQVGQKINGKVTGKSKLYNGYAEATDLDVSEAAVTEGEAPAPEVITIAKLKSTYYRHQNMYVKLEGVTFTTDLTKTNRNGFVSQDSESIAVYAQVANSIEMSGTGDLVCLPTTYYTTNAHTIQLGVFESGQFTKTN